MSRSEQEDHKVLPTLTRGDNGDIRVSGCLDVETVGGCRDDGVDMMAESGGEVVFDLSQSDVKGSAAVALLIAWQREALARSLPMSVTGASPRLLEIARACGVSDIIPFRGSE